MHWVPAYVALGSNLAGPERQVATAFERLAHLPETLMLARSQMYRSRPLGPQDQADFVNAAAGLLTRLPAATLLAELKKVERDMGRAMPVVKWGPRVIDLDLLLYGGAVSGSGDSSRGGAVIGGAVVGGADRPEPVLPHPGIHERNFVLYPLAEIAPDAFIPGRGRVAELARHIGSEGLQRLKS